MVIRYTFVCSAVLGLIALQATSAHALSMHECSAKYQAAKSAGTLNGMKWNEFRKSQCGAEAMAAPAPTPAAAPAPLPSPTRSAAPVAIGNAVFPSAIDPKYSNESAGKGAERDLPRTVQRQQGEQRERRLEMDSEGRRLLQRMQQTSEGSSLIKVRSQILHGRIPFGKFLVR
jgi:hypothetical protein